MPWCPLLRGWGGGVLYLAPPIKEEEKEEGKGGDKEEEESLLPKEHFLSVVARDVIPVLQELV